MAKLTSRRLSLALFSPESSSYLSERYFKDGQYLATAVAALSPRPGITCKMPAGWVSLDLISQRPLLQTHSSITVKKDSMGLRLDLAPAFRDQGLGFRI